MFLARGKKERVDPFTFFQQLQNSAQFEYFHSMLFSYVPPSKFDPKLH